MAENTFDKACRILIRDRPSEFIAWLIREATDHYQFDGLLETQHIPFPGESNRDADAVARLNNLDEGGQPYVFDIEFQTTPDPNMIARIMIYLGCLKWRLRPDPEKGSRYALGAVLINLTGRGNTFELSQCKGTKMKFDNTPLEWNLADLKASDLLDWVENHNNSNHLLPLTPLMREGNNEEIIERWVTQIMREPDLARRKTYCDLVEVFAELVDTVSIWEARVGGLNVRESTVMKRWNDDAKQEGIQEGINQGKSLGLIEFCTNYLRSKYGTLPVDLESSLRGTTDFETAERWMIQALNSTSLNQFRESIGK